MAGKCSCQKMRIAYPRHRFQPEDLLNFIESSEFTAQWAALGLDDEDDLWSLQTCIMVRPRGDGEIEGIGGLHRHTHYFQHRRDRKFVTVYYGYFEDYGIVYLSCFDEHAEPLTFSAEERNAIRRELEKVFAELERLKFIRTSGKSARGTGNDKAI